MDVLRSPQKLEIIGDPSAKHLIFQHSRERSEHRIKGGKAKKIRPER